MNLDVLVGARTIVAEGLAVDGHGATLGPPAPVQRQVWLHRVPLTKVMQTVSEKEINKSCVRKTNMKR